MPLSTGAALSDGKNDDWDYLILVLKKKLAQLVYIELIKHFLLICLYLSAGSWVVVFCCCEVNVYFFVLDNIEWNHYNVLRRFALRTVCLVNVAIVLGDRQKV